ncbi:MAG: hypothetical protein M1538_00235 [Candidatus Marsarchaeota archaeon]|jgi:hypothetical protein|nr:hypothetical protein [Candidatus Marsarchaeota archaeon]
MVNKNMNRNKELDQNNKGMKNIGENKFKMHKFYLLACQEDIDLGKLAESIISIQGVRMINIKERSNKLLIKTKLRGNIKHEAFANILAKKIGGRYGKFIDGNEKNIKNINNKI